MRYLMGLVWITVGSVALFQTGCSKSDDAADRVPAATPTAGPGPVETPEPSSPGENMVRFFTALEGNWSGKGAVMTSDTSIPNGNSDFDVTTSAQLESPQRWRLTAHRAFADGSAADSVIVFEVRGNELVGTPGGQTPAEQIINVQRATPTVLAFTFNWAVDGQNFTQTTRDELLSPTLLREETTVMSNGAVVGREHFEVTSSQQ